MKRFFWVLLTVAGVVAVGAVLLWLPEWMANQYRFVETKDWAGQVAANRAMLVNLLGGVAVALTIYFTYRNLDSSEEIVG